MPQMAPMYWLFLFFYFLVIFLVFIMLTYYFVVPANNNVSGVEVNNSVGFNWSW